MWSPKNWFVQYFTVPALYSPLRSLFVYLLTSLAVEVNFNEDSYTVAESDGQVSVSLRIDGQFYIPVWAIVEIKDGTATGAWVV